MDNENKNTENATVAKFDNKLVSYSDKEIENLAGNARIKIARDMNDVCNFINAAIALKNRGEKMLVGKISDSLGGRIENDTGVNLRGYHLELRADEIRHIIKQHGTESTENSRGQRAITADDVARFANIVANYDDVNSDDRNGLHFRKDIDGVITAVALHAKQNKSLSLQTMYAKKRGGRETTPHRTS